MSNVKITQLPNAAIPLTGAEVYPAVQNGVTKQVTLTQMYTNPTFISPSLGVVAQANLINAVGLPISTGVAGLGTGVATFLGTPTSANLRAAVTDETGTGSLVFANSPALVTPDLGVPSALVATNVTGTALGLTAGNVVTNANLTGAITSVGNATSLGSFTSANLRTALTDETGSGSAVFATSPTLVTPVLGTPTSGNFSTGTFTWPTFNQNTTGTAANITATSNSTLTTLSVLSLPGSQVTGNISGNAANVTGTVAVANGGTGLTTTPANGALDIGNGTGFTRTTLTAGSGVSIANTSGAITISATGLGGTVTSVGVSGGTTGLTTFGGPITSSGTITLGGTLATTNGGTGLTSFTANGVVYASSTSALTTGSALTFNGSTLATLNANASFTSGSSNTAGVITSGAAGSQGVIQFGSSQTTYNIQGGPDYLGMIYNVGSSAHQHIWQLNGSEQMRLTSTGLGIGTSSPFAKLAIEKTGGDALCVRYNSANPRAGMYIGGSSGTPFFGYNLTYSSGNVFNYETTGMAWFAGSPAGSSVFGIKVGTGTGGTSFGTDTGVYSLAIDTSGNLGLGVTPSAWGTQKALEFAYGGLSIGTGLGVELVANTYWNGTNWIYRTSSNAQRYEQDSNGHKWYTAPSGTAGSAISFTQAMTLDAAGALLLGTTSKVSSETLQVYGNFSIQRNASFTAYTGSGSTLVSGAGATDFAIRSDAAMVFAAGGSTERARIDTSGNLLVGTTSATIGQNGAWISPSYTRTGSSGIYLAHQSGAATGDVYAGFGYNAGLIGSITQSGTTAVLYNITSDQRLKENIQDADSASALIDSLQVRQYDWKADGNHQRYGFVAQELVTVAPEAVHQPADPDEMMAVDYSKLVPMLVKEIQSLRKRLAAAGIA